MGRRPALCIALALGALVAACVPPGPAATLDAYARALDAGRLDRAYALTARRYRRRVSRAAFGKAFATAAARRLGAGLAQAAAASLVVVPAGATPTPLLVPAGKGWAVVPPPPEAPAPGSAARARAAARTFVRAVDHRDFEAAYAALAGPLRGRYTPARLKADFEAAGKAATGAVDRIRAALKDGAAVVVRGDRAYLPLGGDRRLRLVREDGAWRVAALR